MRKAATFVTMGLFIAMSAVTLLARLSRRSRPSANPSFITRDHDRSLSLCLNCGLNITFLEENETLAPTQFLPGPTPPPAVVPDSQLGLELSPPTMAPTLNDTFYNNTLSETFGDAALENTTMEDSTSSGNRNTSKSIKWSKRSSLRFRSKGEGMLWELRQAP